MPKAEKKKPKHGYLYLIEVRPRRPWLHKIGITQNPSARFESIGESNGDPAKVLRVVYVKGYERHEAKIKDYFSNRQYVYHPLKGNGSTEVFRFTWLDLAIITIYMEWLVLMEDWRIVTGLYLIALLALAYGIYSWSPEFFEWAAKSIAQWLTGLLNL